MDIINIGPWEIAVILLLILVIIWSFIWKSIALWKCGRNNQLAWFITLLLINTAGILEIIYILFFQSKKSGSK